MATDHTIYTNLNNVNDIARGDARRRVRYLRQFVELITERSAEVKKAFAAQDKVRVRMIVHSMKPQVLFFGVKEAQEDIEFIELNAETGEREELQKRLTSLLDKCERARLEITKLLEE